MIKFKTDKVVWCNLKNLLINNSLNIIEKQYPEYTKTKMEEIEYGLISIYLVISKFIIISIIAVLLDIFKEFILFSCLYNIIRMPSFGLHATKSWICLLSSIIIFIGGPYICKYIIIPKTLVLILGIIGIFFIFKNSPADTEKRPIINKTRRLMLKIISTIISIFMVIFAVYINNVFISNTLIFVLIIQCLMISPYVYKVFGLQYDNYKKYISV